MDHRQRARLIWGSMLVLAGIVFLVAQIFPGWSSWFRFTFSWPMILVGIGAVMLMAAVFAGAPQMAVPACVLAGLGGLMLYQISTGNWTNWSYVWTLIPGFVGVGTILSGLLQSDGHTLRRGARLISTSIVLFVVFAAFFGGLTILGLYWPVALIVVGLLLVAETFFFRR